MAHRPSASEMSGALHQLGNPDKARDLSRYFKTGPGEYAEGDRFIGVTMPEIRRLARQFRDASLAETRKLLRSPIHEERMLGVVLLVERFKKSDKTDRERIYALYVNERHALNNWDLIDISAPHIAGGYLRDADRSVLDEWAASDRIWDRRLAMLATAAFIRDEDFDDALRLARRFLDDKHDLMHKDGVDAAGDRKEQPGCAGGFPAGALRPDAADHAALCDRETARAPPPGVSEGDIPAKESAKRKGTPLKGCLPST